MKGAAVPASALPDLYEDLFAPSTRKAPPVQESPMPIYRGSDLAAYRRGRGLTQSLLAHQMGVSQGTIAKAEGAPEALLGPVLRAALFSASRVA